MYLTDEIFKTTDPAATADHPHNSPSTQPMDSNTPSSEYLGKRKRGAAGDHEYTTNTVPIKNIKILPTHLDPFDDYPPPPPPPPYSSQPVNPYPSPPRHHRKTLLPRIFAQQQPRRNNNNTYLHAPVRPAQRLYPVVARPTRQPSTLTTTTTTTTTTDLTPCHCCHRAPRQKPDLDNYSACAACGARTCYICMRVCERGVGCGRGSGRSGNGNNNLYATDDGGNGNGDGNGNEDGGNVDADAHNASNGRKICRECCVERGPEGETWCFECVAVGDGAERGEEEAEAEGMVMG